MMNNNRWTGGTDEEYETQHFGFGVQRLQISVRQMIEQKVVLRISDMQEYLQKALDLNETDKATLSYFCDKLIRLYCEGAAPSLEIIDREFENIFRIPPNVLLPEDQPQSDPISDSEYEKLKAEVAMLRKQIERGALMEALLISEEEEISSVEKVCEVARKDMEVLDLLSKDLSNIELPNIVNESEFLSANVPFLKKVDALNTLDGVE